jgi:hypothetical protein
MEIQKRIDALLGGLRDARRALAGAAFIGAVAALAVFALGSYYALFQAFEKIVENYYSGILRSVSSIQQTSIRRESYRADLQRMTLAIKDRPGVIEAWCADRYGKLVFHTDAALLDEYSSKRLPSDYYESITHAWSFEGRYPEIRSVRLPGRLHRRLSIPVYAFGNEDYDFVIGIDVKRFVFLPDKPERLIATAAGAALGAFLLLFLPVLLVLRGRLGGVMTQARFILGAIQLELQKETRGREAGASTIPAESETGEAGSEERGEPAASGHTEAMREPAQRSLSERLGAGKEEKAVDEGEEQEPEAPEGETRAAGARASGVRARSAGERKEKKERKHRTQERIGAEAGTRETAQRDEGARESAIDDKMKMIPFLLLMDAKQAMYKKLEAELPFIQASAAGFHSRGSAGCYLHTFHRGARRVFTIFGYPDLQPEEATAQLSGIARFLEGRMEEPADAVDVMKSFDTYCRDNKFQTDASMVFLDESEKRVHYCSAGSVQALYLKNGEQDFKTFKLETPALGASSKAEFDEKASYAEISFLVNDLFLLTPGNAANVFAGEESFEALIKRVAISGRMTSPHDIVAEIQALFDPVRRKEKNIPETGLAVFKFTGN